MKATRTPKLIGMKNLEEAADCLKTLAHPVRLRMVQLMLQGEFTVGELAAACEIPSHMASEHLRMMQHCGFLNRRQQGRRIVLSSIRTGRGANHELYRKAFLGWLSLGIFF